MGLSFMRTPRSRTRWVGWISHNGLLVTDGGAFGVAHGGGGAAVGHFGHEIRRHGEDFCQAMAHLFPGGVDPHAVDDAVRSAKVDVLEGAGVTPPGLIGKGNRSHAILV